MGAFSAGGSTPITRIINGDTLYFYFDTNGIPLYQGVDTENGNISPSWATAANQPVITPQCSSALGNNVTLSGFTWYYNGTAITFASADSGWVTSTNFDGKFQLNVGDGSLKIVKDLAVRTNPSSDVLRCECSATVAGQKFPQSKSVDVLIQPVSSSSYNGFISASPANLDESHTKSTLACSLYDAQGLLAQANYTVKWYKANDTTVLGTGYTLEVTRAAVDHIQLFICDFYLKSTSEKCATAGILITDTADLFEVKHTLSGTLDTDNTVTATAMVVKSKDNSTYSLTGKTNVAWKTGVYAADASQGGGSVRTIISPTAAQVISFSASDIDKNGTRELHPYVFTEVTWDE